ncbi:MAG: hypothetical protein J7605_18120 [Variovorax sp.]|nr:hypothetical protein [Variovorax sp.]
MRVRIVSAFLSMLLSAAICVATILQPGWLGSLFGLDQAEGGETLETWVAVGVFALASLFTSGVVMSISRTRE